MSSRKRSTSKKRSGKPKRGATPPDPAAERANRRPSPTRRVVFVLLVLVAAACFFLPPRVAQDSLTGAIDATRIYRFDRAFPLFEKAAAWSTLEGEVAYQQARAAWMNGDLEASGAALDLASKQGFDQSRIKRERQLIQIRGGGASTSRGRLPTMLRVAPEDGPAILEAFTAGFLSEGDAAGAAEMLAAWKDADATDPRVDYWAGVLDQTFGVPGDAIEHYRDALQRAPEMSRARLALAGLLKSRLFFTEALANYQILAADMTDNEAVSVGLAVCLLKSGKLDEGETRLEKAVERYPDNQSARLTLAEHELDQDEPKKVIAIVEPLGDEDRDITLNYVLAAAYARLGDREKSDRYFDIYSESNRLFETTQMLKGKYEREPDVKLARQIAANLMLCKWQDAGTWILRTLSMEPDDDATILMMAEYLRRGGRESEALGFEKNAKSRTP